MAESNDEKRKAAGRSGSPLRFMRLKDIVDVSDDMITFVDKYQKVWEAEGKAMIALGEFLTLRSEAMRHQVDMMRMGGDYFKRYTEWVDALMSLRPDTLLQSFMRPPEREASNADADDKGEDAT
jgi:hypothetical protein